MRIVIAGGSGFLGQHLTTALRARGDEVQILTRRPMHPHHVAWDPAGGSGAWSRVVQAADAVINLAGEGIADRRWTSARKASILESRITATRALARAIVQSARPPVFLSGSAIGIYGDRGDDTLTEASSVGSDFLAEVCIEWEREARTASAVTRVALLRTGVVLSADGGALPQMALPFKLFAGGPMGSGRQFISWIHVDDWVALATAAIDGSINGPMNLTAPSPARNAEFARTLGRVLHRPAIVPMPGIALRLIVGEMADAALLGGQRVLPAVAQQLGLTFRYPELEGALRAIYGQP